MGIFPQRWNAGFDTGHLPWQGEFDLAKASGHTPLKRMHQNYDIVQKLGIETVRDGLPPNHMPGPRLFAQKLARMNVIWDLSHYWDHPDPLGYAANVVEEINLLYGPDRPGLWFCFNELAFHPVMRPAEPLEEITRRCVLIWKRIKRDLPKSKLMSAEPMHRVEDIRNQLPLWSHVNAMGLNIFPHEIAKTGVEPRALVEAALEVTRDANNMPLFVTETSLHVGHPDIWKGITTKSGWVRYLDDEIGDLVQGFFYYPILSSVDWNDPYSGNRWDHGLILDNQGLVDGDLADTLVELNRKQR